MKRSWLAALILVLGLPMLASPGSASLTTPTLFDTDFQTGGLGAYVNAQTCLSSGSPQGAGCSTAGPNCTVVALAVSSSTGLAVFKSCTIYPLNAAGETSWAQDQLNYAMVAAFNQWTQANLNQSWCAAWKATSGVNQTTANTDIGAPAGALPPCQ